MSKQRVHRSHFVLGHLVEDLLETLDVIARQAFLFFQVFEFLTCVSTNACLLYTSRCV